MAPPRELISDAVLWRNVELVMRIAVGCEPVCVLTATPPPASAPLPVNVLLVIDESTEPIWLSLLIAPPIAFATLSVNVLLLTLIAPRTRIAPPPLNPPVTVEKLLLKTLSVTVTFAKALIAPPDHAAMLLLNSHALTFNVLPVNESAPPSLTLLKPLLTVIPEIVNDSTTPPNEKMR